MSSCSRLETRIVFVCFSSCYVNSNVMRFAVSAKVIDTTHLGHDLCDRSVACT